MQNKICFVGHIPCVWEIDVVDDNSTVRQLLESQNENINYNLHDFTCLLFHNMHARSRSSIKEYDHTHDLKRASSHAREEG